MDALIFSQAAVFRLQKLASLLHQHTGVRHKLSNKPGIVNLLTAGVQSKVQEISDSYQAVVQELNSRQIIALAEQGILIQTSSLKEITQGQRTG